MATLAALSTIASVFRMRMDNEHRVYTNWLREDYARQMGFKQFCFTDWRGRDKMRNVSPVHMRSDEAHG